MTVKILPLLLFLFIAVNAFSSEPDPYKQYIQEAIEKYRHDEDVPIQDDVAIHVHYERPAFSTAKTNDIADGQYHHDKNRLDIYLFPNARQYYERGKLGTLDVNIVFQLLMYAPNLRHLKVGVPIPQMNSADALKVVQKYRENDEIFIKKKYLL